MAHELPNDVVEILNSLNTDNASVVRDIVMTALSLPVHYASKLEPRIRQAAKDGLLSLCFKDAATLCTNLAEEGHTHSAELLAIALFTPRLNKHNNSSWEEHEYKEGLEKVIPVLATRLHSNKFLKKLCIWLHQFIKDKKHSNPQTGEDYSHIWRPAIENHAENYDYDLADSMVTFVRNGFELAIENKKINLDSAFKIIDKQDYFIFKRIKLHLINRFAEQNPEIARAAILNQFFFKMCKYKHEYARLVECQFPLLREHERQEWFSWIESGPDSTDLKYIESIISEEQISGKQRYWKYEKLHWARQYLNISHKLDYEALKKEFGNLALPNLNISSYAGMIGSPIATEDLLKLNFKEAVKTVSEWRSSSQSLSGIEELANAFQEYTSAQPADCSNQAKELIGSPAIFSAKFIEAMTLAVKSGSNININAVLNLCEWASSCFAADFAIARTDRYCNWAISEISLFIKAICKATENDFPKYSMQEFRNRIWQIILCICQINEDVVFIGDNDDDPRSKDYIQTGINSLKGQAIEAALEYARWIFNHFKQSANKSDSRELAEVMELLEWRLSAENRTPGELAMIGSNIHLLYAVDKTWLGKHAETLFPLKNDGSSPNSLEWAAWNAFLLSSHPHIEFYKLFEKQFAYAVKQAPFIQAPKYGSVHNPIQRLGEHLAILYIRGELSLHNEKLSLKKFIAEVTLDIKHHTIEFIGRILKHHKEASEDVIKRCIKLWEEYWSDNGKNDELRSPRNWSFESWLACRKFPKEWCLKQFERFLQSSENPEISSLAMEELAWIADQDFKKSVEILDIIVRGDKEGLHIPGWQDVIYSILETALKNNPSCHQSRKLIDYLGRSGYLKFGTLIF